MRGSPGSNFFRRAPARSAPAAKSPRNQQYTRCGAAVHLQGMPLAYFAKRDFPSGLEGVISFLKRGFGLVRCTWSGFESRGLRHRVGADLQSARRRESPAGRSRLAARVGSTPARWCRTLRRDLRRRRRSQRHRGHRGRSEDPTARDLEKAYGKGRWRKVKGFATVRLENGAVCPAEIHWYEAHGIGRKRFKIKRFL